MFAYATNVSYDSCIYHVMSAYNREFRSTRLISFIFSLKFIVLGTAIDEVRNSNKTSFDQE